MGELESYLRSLAGKGNEGAERGPAAALLRRVTSPGLRLRGKLAVTAVMGPAARRQARHLTARGDVLLVNLGSGSRPVESPMLCTSTPSASIMDSIKLVIGVSLATST